MESPFVQIEEDHFANACYSKNIECILPMAELFINFKVNGLKTRKACFVYAEKLDFKGLIQIRITEKSDQRRMYITTVDSGSFPELKQDQSLHVTFAGFIDNLVRLLQDCQAGKLEIYMIHQSTTRNELGFGNESAAQSALNFQMQFLEMRPFKNLIHLCLPCRLAPINVVLFYMNSILDAMQKKLGSHEQKTQQLQHELLMYQRRNEELETENAKVHDVLEERSHNLSQRHVDEVQKLQEALRKTNEQTRNEIESQCKTINGLQVQVEKLNQETCVIKAERSQDLKRYDALKDELSAANSKVTQLKTQNEQLQSEIATFKNEERKAEMHLSDARRHINELKEKLKKYDKNKDDIVAELEAEKKISQTKRHALEVASEEISKANEIIYKQSQELLKLKKTIAWRTDIALEQEKAIKEKERNLAIYDEELKQTKMVLNSLRGEVPQQLESLRQFANSLEIKYKGEISALRESLRAGIENTQPYSSRALSTHRK